MIKRSLLAYLALTGVFFIISLSAEGNDAGARDRFSKAQRLWRSEETRDEAIRLYNEIRDSEDLTSNQRVIAWEYSSATREEKEEAILELSANGFWIYDMQLARVAQRTRDTELLDEIVEYRDEFAYPYHVSIADVLRAEGRREDGRKVLLSIVSKAYINENTIAPVSRAVNTLIGWEIESDDQDRLRAYDILGMFTESLISRVGSAVFFPKIENGEISGRSWITAALELVEEHSDKLSTAERLEVLGEIRAYLNLADWEIRETLDAVMMEAMEE